MVIRVFVVIRTFVSSWSDEQQPGIGGDAGNDFRQQLPLAAGLTPEEHELRRADDRYDEPVAPAMGTRGSFQPVGTSAIDIENTCG